MTALAADRKVKTRAGVGRSMYMLVAAAAVIYQGALVAVNATGYIVPASSTAGVRVIGWATTGANNASGGNGAIGVQIETGSIAVNNDPTNPVVQADIGRHCFITDDNTIANSLGGSSVVAGIVEQLDITGQVYLYVDPSVCNISGGTVYPAGDNNLGAGIYLAHSFVIADAATATYSLVIKEKFQVVDVIVRKTGAGAGNTAQVLNGVTAISDAIVAAVDKTVTRAGTIDPAQEVVAAGGTLAVTVTRAAGSGAMQVTVVGRKVA